jgi:hypothetical protein
MVFNPVLNLRAQSVNRLPETIFGEDIRLKLHQNISSETPSEDNRLLVMFWYKYGSCIVNKYGSCIVRALVLTGLLELRTKHFVSLNSSVHRIVDKKIFQSRKYLVVILIPEWRQVNVAVLHWLIGFSLVWQIIVAKWPRLSSGDLRRCNSGRIVIATRPRTSHNGAIKGFWPAESVQYDISVVTWHAQVTHGFKSPFVFSVTGMIDVVF